jgi:glycosyltransferase 2 family protein
LKNVLLNILKFIVFLSIGVVLLYFAFKGINFSKLKENIEGANYLWVVLSLLCGATTYWVRAKRWNLLIEPLGYKPSLINSYHSVIIGYLANFAFPRIGEITRCGTLNRIEKIPADKLIGTVIAERSFDFLTFLILLITAFAIKINFFGSYFSENIFRPAIRKVSTTLNFSVLFWIILAVSIVVGIIMVFTFRVRIKKITLVRKIGKIGKGVLSGAKSVFKIKRKLEFIFFTIILWSLYFLMGYIIFFSLPSTSGLTLIDGLFILVVGSCGMIVPVQGGIGTFHLFVSNALAIYGISPEDGMAYAVISHESQSFIAIILGITSFFILFIRNHKKIAVNGSSD